MIVTCVLGYSPVIAYGAGQPYRDSPFILTLECATGAGVAGVRRLAGGSER
jgi:hypothetical protein